jgi:hypothetical protein
MSLETGMRRAVSRIVPFPKSQQLRTPLAQLFRVGASHVQFGDMFASGGLARPPAVFEAGQRSRHHPRAQHFACRNTVALNTKARCVWPLV